MTAAAPLDRVGQTLMRYFGKNSGAYTGSFLRQSIERRMKETLCASMAVYCDRLEEDYSEARALLACLSIQYSIFFRDPLVFALLERTILPELVQTKNAEKQREIRIWSAGCAAGQEAYSIAMLLEELKTDSPIEVKYRIFATDSDEAALAEAQAGVYSASALRNVSLSRFQAWFDRQGDTYAIRPAVRQYVSFSLFDLLGGGQTSPPASIFGDFDLIFCSNVLIYYKTEYQNRLLEKLNRSLSSGGYLVTDDSEQAIALGHSFRSAFPPAAVFQKTPMNRKVV